jgi:hypothetical protein
VPGPPLSRRRLLRTVGAATALGTGLLTGCDLDFSSSPSTQPTSRPSPDERIVLAARAELSDLIRRVSTLPGHRPLLVAHREQLAALDGHPPSPARRTRAITVAQLKVRERRAAASFAHWATTCPSGDLARVLASISAGIRMQPILQEPT